MRIFVIAGSVPFRKHGVRGVHAGHIVLWNILHTLQREGHAVSFQYLFHPTRAEETLTAPEQEEMDALRSDGMRLLPPLQWRSLHAGAKRRHSTMQLLWNGDARLAHFSPAVCLREVMQERVRDERPDVILTVWSPEGVAATHGIGNIPRVAYHGDVEWFVRLCNFRDRALFGGRTAGSPLQWIDQRIKLWLQERAHRALMQEVDVIANITACNAEYYTRKGHPRSVYVGNTWTEPQEEMLRMALQKGESDNGGCVKIIGHIGGLNHSGSTYGLRFLLQEVIPHLEGALRGRSFEVHVIGGGECVPALRPLLAQKNLVVRGFVEDLDRELLESDVMLLLNNAGPYQAAFTRHLVAWSMGLCLIAHEKSRLAIPEIAHGRNALLGNTGREIAEHIARAVSDRALNLSLRKGGRETYEKHFTPQIITGKLAALLHSAAR